MEPREITLALKARQKGIPSLNTSMCQEHSLNRSTVNRKKMEKRF